MMLVHLTAFLQRNTRRTGDQMYCTGRIIYVLFIWSSIQKMFFFFTKFISNAPQPGLSGLGFDVGFFFFLMEGEVMAPIPSHVSDRAAVDHRGAMGSSAATCP